MPSDPSPDRLVTKKVIAARYGVSVRTVNSWMRRRILPYLKLSERMVRFDPAICDAAMKAFEFKSIFDETIREELRRAATENGGEPLRIAGELGIALKAPQASQGNGGRTGAKP